MVCYTSAWGRERSECGGACPGWRAVVCAPWPQGAQERGEVCLWEGHVALSLRSEQEGGYPSSMWGLLPRDGRLSPPGKGRRASSLGAEVVGAHGSSCLWRQQVEKSHRLESLGQRLNYVGTSMAACFLGVRWILGSLAPEWTMN